MRQDDRAYGLHANEIDPFFRSKREWSKVKDKILHDYITCYLKTIHARGRPIVIVDAFSGPGRFGDGLDGSPLIICNAIATAPKRRVGLACLFADSHPAHRAALETQLADHVLRGITGSPLADFSAALSKALEIGTDSTLFFYLDPYGIKDLDFATVRQIYERNPAQSTEVLINFNFKAFMRMSGNWSYCDSASEVSKKIKEAKVETVNAVMDGDYWIEIITDASLDTYHREDAIVSKYMERIREFFEYTYSIPVKELDESAPLIPTDSLAKYHLIFGTRSGRAVVYMNDVAINALEPYFRQFKDGLLFELTPERYEKASIEEVKQSLVDSVAASPLARPAIFESTIPQYFMQRRKKDYRALIDDLTFKEGRLFPNPRTIKTKGRLNDETLLSTRPWPKGDEA